MKSFSNKLGVEIGEEEKRFVEKLRNIFRI